MWVYGTLVLVLGVVQARRWEATLSGPRCPPNANCQEKNNVTGTFTYLVEDETLTVIYSERKSLKLTCPRNVSLESASLPRFDNLTDLENVVLQGCALPSKGLAHALDQLRIQPRDTLELRDVPAVVTLTAAHLAGLSVRSITLEGDGSLSAEEDAFSALPQLKDVRLSRMRLEPTALLSLPVGLTSLWLKETALEALPREVLARLPALRYLLVYEAHLRKPPELDAAIAVAVLMLRAPRVDSLVAGPMLENATLIDMNLTSITGACPLRRLVVMRARAVGGLAACTRLHSVTLLASASPSRDFLRGLEELRDLNFANTKLRELPSGLFSASTQLERLDLSGTGLSAPALAALEPFTELQELTLSNNRLGDLCHSTATYLTNEISPLHSLRKLRKLYLVRTGATRVCRDWRSAATLPALQLLDLRNNNITELTLAEAQWPRGSLDVRGNPLRSVLYDRDDYERALAAPPAPSGASVRVDAAHALTCDCLVYWFARALREHREHAHPELATLACDAPPSPHRGPAPLLVRKPLESLVCDVPKEECAAGCSCTVDGERSVLRCEGGNLTALPAPPARLLKPRAIYAANNNISSLPTDVAPEITLLDVRDNVLTELPLETWTALLADGRRLLLGGNRLLCGCDQLVALKFLQAHPDQLDASNVTCSDGRALLALRPDEECSALAPRSPLPALLGALLGATLLATLLVLACLARPASRRWIKRFLVHHNLCLKLLLRPDRVEGRGGAGEGVDGAGEGDGGQLEYDVFVSFSHHDHTFVEEELAPHLEGATRPRRLCLHYRDWTPGEWIPTQISESVRRSRRTLVVVSAHFLRSQWARAEFRAAHALALRSRRPRLVVLLLAPPATLALRDDPELTAFLANNTYLCRDDPRFWDKLLDALPASAPAVQATPPEKDTAPCA